MPDGPGSDIGGVLPARIARVKASIEQFAQRPSIHRIIPRALAGAIVLFGTYVVGFYLVGFLQDPDRLFRDADIYYQATETWLSGGNPWTARYNGFAFAGVPPTLLLNIPLQSFGLESAKPFWAITGLLAGAFLMWRLRLAWWWVAFPPYWDGLLNGNPDTVLVALAVWGGGAIAALTKPYSVPGLLASGRWRAVLAGGVLWLVTLPLLPWPMFLDQLTELSKVLQDQTLRTSAWGNWPLTIAVALALISLGPRLAMALIVPTLWPPTQLHYHLFSAPAVQQSVALAFALSYPNLAAPAVIGYAIVARLLRGGSDSDGRLPPQPKRRPMLESGS